MLALLLQLQLFCSFFSLFLFFLKKVAEFCWFLSVDTYNTFHCEPVRRCKVGERQRYCRAKQGYSVPQQTITNPQQQQQQQQQQYREPQHE